MRYLIAGGEAVIFHGHARLTGDVNLFYDRSPANTARLYAALAEFWGGSVPGLGSSQDLSEAGILTQYGVPPNRIDLINDIDGVPFDQAWSGRIEASMASATEGSVSVPYIGLAELIQNKVAAARPKDLDDVAYLRRAQKRV